MVSEVAVNLSKGKLLNLTHNYSSTVILKRFFLYLNVDVLFRPESCQNGEVRTAGVAGELGSRVGRVEYCLDNKWGVVCGNSWTPKEAAVVCRQLGYGLAVDIHPVKLMSWAVDWQNYTQAPPTFPLALDNVKCKGDERSLRECYNYKTKITLKVWQTTCKSPDGATGVRCARNRKGKISVQRHCFLLYICMYVCIYIKIYIYIYIYRERERERESDRLFQPANSAQSPIQEELYNTRIAHGVSSLRNLKFHDLCRSSGAVVIKHKTTFPI